MKVFDYQKLLLEILFYSLLIVCNLSTKEECSSCAKINDLLPVYP